MYIKCLLCDVVNTVHSPPDLSSFLQLSECTTAHKAEYSMVSVRNHQGLEQSGTPSTPLSHWSPIPSSPYHASPGTTLCRREVATEMRTAVLKLSEGPQHQPPPLHCEHQLVLAGTAEEEQEGLQGLLFHHESEPSAQVSCLETSSTEP